MTTSACLVSDTNVSPKDGASNAPLNTVVRVQYYGLGHIRAAQINSANFKLQTCSSPSEGPATNTETPPTSRGGSPVSGRVTSQRFNTTRTYEDGRVEKLKRTDVFFVPIPSDYSNPPLTPDTDYCFTATEVSDSDGKKHLPISLTFRSTSDSDFNFAEETQVVDWLFPDGSQRPGGNFEVAPSDILVFEFAHPVLPKEVEQGTVLCERESENLTSRPQDSLCKGYGEQIEPSIAQVESFEEKDGFVLANYTTYAIRLENSLIEGPYTARVGLGESGQHVSGASRKHDFSVTGTDSDTPSDDIQARLRKKYGEKRENGELRAFSMITENVERR